MYEAPRIEMDLPHKLLNNEVKTPNASEADKSTSSNLDLSKVPKRLTKQINTALSKVNGQKPAEREFLKHIL